MRLLTIVYSRMSSNRFPGKALKCISGVPLIEHMVQSLSSLEELGRVIIGTSNHQSDEPIVAHCTDLGMEFFRGDLSDVSLRTEQIISEYSPDFICRVCGDRPLLTPDFIEYSKQIFLDKFTQYERISNLKSQFDPPGLKLEFIRSKTFSKYRQYFSEEEREHITKYFYYSARYDRAQLYKYNFNKSDHTDVNFCVDTENDLKRINKVMDVISANKKDFNHLNVYSIMRNHLNET